MRWRQVSVAAVLGLSAGYLLWADGVPLSVSAAVAVLVYFAVRWFIAWASRIRYWYRRGTRGIYTRSCPDCGQYIYRASGDWIIECHRCGWTAGLPVVRWLTKSVPSIQLRRTVWSPQLLVVVVAVGVVVAGGIPAGYLAYDGQVDAGDTDDNLIESTAETSDYENSDSEIQEVEQYIYDYTNEERQERGLPTLSYSSRIATAARQHSQSMAQRDELYHGNVQSRYPCGYAGENAAQNYDEFDNEDTAEAIVEQWMNSPGHRANILREGYSSIGVGVHISSGGEVWATQGFCG